MIPDTIGACADRLAEIRDAKRELERGIKVLDEERREIEDHLIATLSKSDSTGVSGKVARVRIVTDEIPAARDWPALWRYVQDHDAWDLLQKRLSSGAVKDRWAEGVQIPGVEPYTAVKVSLTKT